MRTKKQHKHFIVAPIALSLIALSAGHQVLATYTADVTGSVTSYKIADTQLDVLSHGLRVLKYDDAEVGEVGSAAQVVYGSTTFSAPGMYEVLAGNLRIMGMDGAIFISTYGDNVAIAPITSPALVIKGDSRALIPVGKQWTNKNNGLPSFDVGMNLWLTSRQSDIVPTAFFESKFRDVQALPPLVDDGLVETRSIAPFAVEKSIRALLLPTARGEADTHWQDALIGHLRYLADEQKRDEFIDLLASDNMTEVLDDPEVTLKLSALLASLQQGSEFAIHLFQVLTSRNSDYATLASQHPAYRNLAWTISLATLSKEQQIVSVIMLPKTDINTKAVSSVAVKGWGSALFSILDSSSDPAFLLPALVQDITGSIVILEQSMYPQRAKNYSEATVAALQPFEDMLSPEALVVYQGLQSQDQVRMYEYVASQEAPETQEETQNNEEVEEILQAAAEKMAQAESVPADQIESLADTILKEAGALHTTFTTIKSHSPNTAEVKGIVFSSQHSDRTFNFLLNVKQGRVSQIQEGSTVFPYAMWVEDFVAWAKK